MFHREKLTIYGNVPSVQMFMSIPNTKICRNALCAAVITNDEIK
jgi:hypothetical protein